MSFWDFFKGADAKSENYGEIYNILQNRIPELSHDEALKLACISGLLARVAYADMQIDVEEVQKMNSHLQQELGLDSERANLIVDLTVQKTKELAGLENHVYCNHLIDFIDQNERLHFLVTLFQLAASDGSVDGVEVEEIRTIATALKLPHSDFVRAKATVADRLAALKK